MKTHLLALLTLGLAAGALTPAAEAADCRRIVSAYYVPYRLSTCEIARSAEGRTAYNDCGYRYFYRVSVVTYRDYYSDGSTRTYTRTFRS